LELTSKASVILVPGRESSVLRRHPWIFSGAVRNVQGNPSAGETVEIYSSAGQWLARGSYSPGSQIRIRILTFDAGETVDETFFENRIRRAVELRQSLPGFREGNCARLIFSESDSLPGLIVDKYDDFLVCQFLSAGAEFWKDVITPKLQEIIPCRGIFERSDSDSRAKEGFAERTGLISGEEPPARVAVDDGKMKFWVDIRQGHKTGFYLDQRLNRLKIMDYANGREVLNAFSYTGGFGVAAAIAGASTVVNVDSSKDALELATENFRLNGLALEKSDFAEDDVFQLLREYRDRRRQFDMIVLDPPKFVASASQLDKGTRGYKDINLLAFKLLRPGGILVTFSCSGYVKPDLFAKIVSDAALDAGRDAVIVENLHQSPDHPVALNFPEGLYLKGLICRVS